ncbi:glycosyltransferase family 1 protein [Corallococcus macrosporus]|uniref:Glycosyltransferase family 1 protein n=1 Tax=Corallococcus macrosporus TaxID=35 RepID=A0ABS3DPU1_9BACT|nr:glycosyltransferase [Corallococcus macrosporus]MBN8233344.1 glycosyltransferase family 1 protein [Corallococcus macrosporus]
MAMAMIPERVGSRATFLMVSFHGKGKMKGHLLRVLDQARELVARGHRVLVFTDGDAREEVEAAGAELVPYQRYREIGERMTHASGTLPWWAKRSRVLYMQHMLRSFRNAWLDSARDYAQELEPVLRDERVDCVVYDFFSVGAGYAAERVGIPSASLCNAGGAIDAAGLPLLMRKWALGRWVRKHVPGLAHWLMDRVLPLRRVRKELGLPPRATKQAEFFQALASPQLNIPMVPAGFLEGIPLRDHQLLSGPIAFDGGASEDAPLGLLPGTVLVSTTTVGGDRGLLGKVLKAVDPMGVPVLATSGDSKIPEGLGAHVRVERFVPHEQVFPHVAAVITHGGWGTVGRALRHGVPMLIIPLFSDQPLNAHLAHEQGLAYHLPFAQATPEAIRERLQALLSDHALHARLKQVSAELRARRTEAPASDALEQLALGERRFLAPASVPAPAPDAPLPADYLTTRTAGNTRLTSQR